MPNNETNPPVARFISPEGVSDQEVYRFLYTYYFHQDRLMWSRIQVLGVVEIAALGAAFSRGGLIAILALVLGSWLIWLIHSLIQRDEDIRDQYLKAPEGSDPILDSVHKPRGIRLTPPETNNWRRGKFILDVIFKTILCMNMVLILWFSITAFTGSPLEDHHAQQLLQRFDDQLTKTDEHNAHIDAILATVDQQAHRLEELQSHYGVAQKRIDTLLDKWDEQTKRHDLILNRQEKALVHK